MQKRGSLIGHQLRDVEEALKVQITSKSNINISFISICLSRKNILVSIVHLVKTLQYAIFVFES